MLFAVQKGKFGFYNVVEDDFGFFSVKVKWDFGFDLVFCFKVDDLMIVGGCF